MRKRCDRCHWWIESIRGGEYGLCAYSDIIVPASIERLIKPMITMALPMRASAGWGCQTFKQRKQEDTNA